MIVFQMFYFVPFGMGCFDVSLNFNDFVFLFRHPT